jgi:hypothetical protein
MRHYLVAMAAVPEWAPRGETHILRSTSVVTRAEYAPARVAWTTFDEDATETLRVPTLPSVVTIADDVRVPERTELDDDGYTVAPLASGGFVVRVRHREPGEVAITLLAAAAEPAAPAEAGAAAAGAPASESGGGPTGCSIGPGAGAYRASGAPGDTL